MGIKLFHFSFHAYETYNVVDCTGAVGRGWLQRSVGRGWLQRTGGRGWVWGCTHLSDYSGFNLPQCHMYFLCAYIFTVGCRDPFRCYVVFTGNTETPL